MNYSHVGHDCQVGNDVIFATSATLGGSLRDRRLRLHRRSVRRASVHADRPAGDGRRRLRRARRRHSVRPRQRPVCEPRRPQPHRHEAAQVHQASGSPTVRAFYQKLFHGPGIFAERLERCSRSPARIPRSPRSSTSSRRASIARSAFPRIANSDDGIAAAMTSAASGISSPVGVVAGGGAHAVRGRGLARRTRHRAGAVRAARRLRSGAGRNGSAITGSRSGNSAARCSCFAAKAAAT